MIHRLQLTQFRHLASLSLSPTSGISIIHGANGAGKTSVLEAIRLLSTGRSFLTSHLNEICPYNQAETCAVIHAECAHDSQSVKLGLQRCKDKSTLRINGANAKSNAELAHLLPTQLITPTSVNLIQGGPAQRRQFMDWGSFYLQPEFGHHWMMYQKVLKQRNASLKKRLPKDQCRIWDAALIEHHNYIESIRINTLEQLTPVIHTLLESLMPEIAHSHEIQWHYKPGYSQQFEHLAEALEHNWDKDWQYANTRQGAHRADLNIALDGREVDHFLSRGQQKMFVCALLLAQAQLVTHTQPILLIDDLPSELDQRHRTRLMHTLIELGHQTFISAIDPDSLPGEGYTYIDLNVL